MKHHQRVRQGVWREMVFRQPEGVVAKLLRKARLLANALSGSADELPRGNAEMQALRRRAPLSHAPPRGIIKIAFMVALTALRCCRWAKS